MKLKGLMRCAEEGDWRTLRVYGLVILTSALAWSTYHGVTAALAGRAWWALGYGVAIGVDLLLIGAQLWLLPMVAGFARTVDEAYRHNERVMRWAAGEPDEEAPPPDGLG